VEQAKGRTECPVECHILEVLQEDIGNNHSYSIILFINPAVRTEEVETWWKSKVAVLSERLFKLSLTTGHCIPD
jgi:hypothetical protein